MATNPKAMNSDCFTGNVMRFVWHSIAFRPAEKNGKYLLSKI